MITEESKQSSAKRFGIKPEEVIWYNNGICYDRIGVTTKEAADKVSAAVKNWFVNGGYFHGMPLGGQTLCSDGTYDVMC